MRKYLLFAFILLVGVSACKKDKFDAAKQAIEDDATIRDFILKNGLTATRDDSGLYYVIGNTGTGTLKYSSSTAITAKYTGRLLNGGIFDRNTTGATFALGNVIRGWQVGIPLIQKGGSIRLLIPSGLAYGNVSMGNGAIPANSILDFDIELVNAQN